MAALLIGARGGRDYGEPAEVAPYE